MIRILANCIIMVAGAILLWGCANDTPDANTGGQLDYSQMEEVTLGTISTAINASQQQSVSRAGGAETPMEVGKTFRLYAFPKGVTDMSKLVTTRTYTIQNVAGDPVLDANQEKLYLPVGEIDIFLVGPVTHDLNEGKIDANGNPLPPNIVDVATPYAVLPQYGIDLVSSKTDITVKPGANQFQAKALEHRMAQMEVVVLRPDGATYTDLNVTEITVMNQTLTGVFEFSDTGGAITPAEEGTVTLSPAIRTTIPDKEFRGTMYVIPREQTQLRIGVFLTCKLPGEASEVDRRMESGIMTEPLVAGQMNRFITQPYLSNQLIFRLRLLPWNDVSMDDINVPEYDAEKLLFSYSGLDAPRMIDGKMCVPDRSGNNRHGEIVGDIRYNAEEKYYYAGSKGAYIKVPDLGSVPVYTLELTAASQRGAQTRAALFADDKGATTLSAYIPWTDNFIWFYSDNKGSASSNKLNIQYSGNDLNILNNLAVYAFTCNESRFLSIRRNGKVLAKGQGTEYDGTMNNNKLLWWSPNDSKTEEPLKLYAARMSAKVSDDAINNNYRNDIANFVGLTVDKDYNKLDYVQNGLVLDLRGTTGATSNPSGYSVVVNNRYAWEDVSRAKNHAVVMSSTRPSYDSSKKCYTFNGSQYMQLAHTLGTIQNATIEIVARSSGTNSQTTLFNFSNRQGGGDKFREIHVHLSWDNLLKYNAPYVASYGRKNLGMITSMNSMAYPFTTTINNPNQWVFKRYNKDGRSIIEAWLNGHLEETVASDVEIPLLEMRYCYIGSNGPTNHQYFNSSIYAIRVYNRQLTDLERQNNYQVDKVKYNLVP